MVKKKFKCISVSVPVFEKMESEKRNCESWDETILHILQVYRNVKSKVGGE